jgi:hypothetical protein
VQNIKHLIDQLVYKYCNPQKGYDLMDVKSALAELAKTLQDKHTEAIVQARLQERTRAREISYEFIRDVDHMKRLIQENFCRLSARRSFAAIGSKYFLVMN